MANYDRFQPATPELPTAVLLTHDYRNKAFGENQTRLPAPSVGETVARLVVTPENGGTSWPDLDLDRYLHLRPDRTSPKVLSDFEHGLYHTHPEDPRDIEAAYMRRFWGHLERDSHGRPINPYGPTGFGGRGELWHFGPRQSTDSFVAVEHDGRDYFLGIEKGGRLTLPGGFVNPEDRQWIMDSHVREIFQETERSVDVFGDEGIVLTEGLPVMNKRMTDHSWVESNGAFFRYTGDIVLGTFASTDGDGQHEIDTTYRWVPANRENIREVAKSLQRGVLFEIAEQEGLITVNE